MLWTTFLIHVVELDAIKVHELAVHRDCFVCKKSANSCDDLSHCTQWLCTGNTNLCCQWIPPRANAENHATWCKVIKRGESCGKAGWVTCPAVNNARTDFDVVGDCSKCRHGNNGITNEAAVGLPHGFETFVLCVLGVFHSFFDGVCILKVDSCGA